MSQEIEIGDANGEVEISEGEMDELGLEEIQNWRKCSKCNRPCSGHEGSRGSVHSHRREWQHPRRGKTRLTGLPNAGSWLNVIPSPALVHLKPYFHSLSQKGKQTPNTVGTKGKFP